MVSWIVMDRGGGMPRSGRPLASYSTDPAARRRRTIQRNSRPPFPIPVEGRSNVQYSAPEGKGELSTSHPPPRLAPLGMHREATQRTPLAPQWEEYSPVTTATRDTVSYRTHDFGTRYHTASTASGHGID
eukprot:Polyplicarium_translucidae@DN2456_c0_g1_i2.p2